MKIRILFLFLFVFSFILPSFSHAQYVPPKARELFDTSKTYDVQPISREDTLKGDIYLPLFPITTIVVPKGSFNENVTFIAYKGVWEKIQPLLPDNQSPISMFYIEFINSKGTPVTPQKPIRIQVYNNYAGTSTFFYPILPFGDIDNVNLKQYSGNIKIDEVLPVVDPAFAVGANMVISKDDPSLNPGGVPKPIQATSAPEQLNTQVILLIGALILLAILLIFTYRRIKKQR